ncbi:hypothetical protein AA313_de0205396 [Arthrobotrys entomopaga]|nr:hypothetical protein AA313_de0205396 [Arthrobotrys entomopaga]
MPPAGLVLGNAAIVKLAGLPPPPSGGPLQASWFFGTRPPCDDKTYGELYNYDTAIVFLPLSREPFPPGICIDALIYACQKEHHDHGGETKQATLHKITHDYISTRVGFERN